MPKLQPSFFQMKPYSIWGGYLLI